MYIGRETSGNEILYCMQSMTKLQKHVGSFCAMNIQMQNKSSTFPDKTVARQACHQAQFDSMIYFWDINKTKWYIPSL